MAECPTNIGNYPVVREIGRGGMGIVYLATDPRLARRVALKLLSPDFAGDVYHRARLHREARALAALNHPNIATIHAVEECEGRTFLVMEYVDGETLAAAIVSKHPDVQTSLTWCEQIAKGMAAAHDAGILHRDLKPANIRLRPDGLVKVLDFGLARSSPSHVSSRAPTQEHISIRTVAGGVLGTPGYLAPEQARGETVDRRADVFSFGCILFECLAARPAFRGASVAELIAAVMRDEPDWAAIPGGTSAGIRRLIERCLAKDSQHRLRDLADAALELRDALRAGSGQGSPPAGADIPNTLPRELTSFVGRESELATIAELLAKTPLVTLIGSGGCGKTRLAIRAARSALASFPGGVWFVDLASISGSADVAGLTVRTLGVPASEHPDRPNDQRLAAALATARALIVLDNAEHVLDGTRELVRTLSEQCPELRVLVTSRETLGLPFEQAFRVPSLGLPPTQAPTPATVESSESGRLFIERARLADPAFGLSTSDAAVLARLCTRLDGIALAIELAAARTATMSLRDIDARLGDALRVLAPTGPGGSVPRHATIRAAIEWSVQMLPAYEAALFEQLAVFSGGWSLAAAEAVCPVDGKAGDALGRLVSRSLVQLHSATGRYRFLETVRQFAAERLDRCASRGDLRSRHADYCLALAERLAEATPGGSSVALAEIGPDEENIRAALRFLESCLSSEDRLPRLAFAMHKWWYVHGLFDEGMHWLTVAIKLRGSATETLDARLAAASGNFAWGAGRYAEARDAFEHSSPVWEKLGEHARVAAMQSNIAIAHDRLGDAERAGQSHLRALQTYERIGDESGLAFARLNFSSFLIHQRRFAEALDVIDRCLPVFCRIGDRHRIGVAMHNLGETNVRKGDLAAGHAALVTAVEHKDAVGDRSGLAHSLLWLGFCLVEQSKDAAASVLALATRLCAESHLIIDRDERERLESARAHLRERLGMAVFEREWQAGSTAQSWRAVL